MTGGKGRDNLVIDSADVEIDVEKLKRGEEDAEDKMHRCGLLREGLPLER